MRDAAPDKGTTDGSSLALPEIIDAPPITSEPGLRKPQPVNIIEESEEMKTNTKRETTGTQPAKFRSQDIRLPTRELRTRNKGPSWKPQPCNISREDMRQIVLEMIG